MERIINIHIERLPEGVYLATSEDVPGLVAQGRTATEALEIALYVAESSSKPEENAQGDLNLLSISDLSTILSSSMHEMVRLAGFRYRGIVKPGPALCQKSRFVAQTDAADLA